MIRDFVEHIIFRFSSDGWIYSISLVVVYEKCQLIDDVVWIDLGLIELTSTRYRHGRWDEWMIQIVYSEIALLFLAKIHMTRSETLLAILKLFLNETSSIESIGGKKGNREF